MSISKSEENKKIIEDFYTAFQKKDGETMASFYAPQSHFEDAVFSLDGSKIGSMWKMLCAGGKDLTIQFSNVSADDQHGTAQWVAEYTFSATGRKVINRITANMTFKDGKIIFHKDHFSFWKWSSQALGLLGSLLGWSRVVRGKVQTLASKNLDAFINENEK